ncbi:phosphohistidine phosphatase [Fontimonas thermophila]|uniref:Phosphohistidine phosphatase n=2 Tax=Fontimonas thermophila TaxID=1076937 RepID=A0A1I2HWG5_9GAMM|nr:phosphohistidine phosphatase [Fontimonas thermophila]
MRLLTLVRHAKSSWDDPTCVDFARPLNERGRRDAPRMATHVLRALGRPDRLISSPALRALTTAQIFAETFSIPQHAIVCEPRIYEAAPETLLGLVQWLDDADRHVMLFGHNPGLSELAHLLARCSFDDLPTCGVVQIGFDSTRWCDIDERAGTQRFYAFPKQLRERS